MFINKLVAITACVALALNFVAASESKIHISVRSHEKSNGCGGGNLVIIGDLGSFCTHAGTPCGGSTEGVCPPAQPALENGSTCTKLSSGEYGCVANTSPAAAASNSTSTASSGVSESASTSESYSTSESDDSTSESTSESESDRASENESDRASESESDSASESEESASDADA